MRVVEVYAAEEGAAVEAVVEVAKGVEVVAFEAVEEVAEGGAVEEGEAAVEVAEVVLVEDVEEVEAGADGFTRSIRCTTTKIWTFDLNDLIIRSIFDTAFSLHVVI